MQEKIQNFDVGHQAILTPLYSTARFHPGLANFFAGKINLTANNGTVGSSWCLHGGSCSSDYYHPNYLVLSYKGLLPDTMDRKRGYSGVGPLTKPSGYGAAPASKAPPTRRTN